MVRDSVLLVDDEPQVLVALEDILCDAFDVVKTECAEQALSVAKRRSDIAVVVTDQRMPRTQGDELASLLSGFSDATRILLTGYADISAVIRAVNEGQIFAYVAKPWSVDDLLHKVHKAAERFHMVRELARERQMLHDLMSSAPDGIFFKDVDLRFTRLNDAHAALSNVRGADNLIGRRLRDLRPQDEEALRIEEEERAVLAGTAAVDVVRRERVGDEQRWLSESKAVILGQTGEPIGLVGIARDITERKLQEARIARLTRIQAMSSAINAGIVRTHERAALLEESCRIAVEIGDFQFAAVLSQDSTTGSVQFVTTHPEALEGVPPVDEPLRATPEASAHLRSLLAHPTPTVLDDLAAVGLQQLGRGVLGVFPLQAMGEGDSALFLLARDADLFDGEVVNLLRDLSGNIAFGLAHISTAKRLDFLANHDDLTSLPKRPLLLDRLTQRISDCEGIDEHPAVLVIGMARFRQINETLGRNAGDQVLVQVATALRAALRERDTLAIIDSHTFAILTVGDRASIGGVVEQTLLPRLRESFAAIGAEVRLDPRIGIALFPGDGDAGDELLAHAEAALDNATGIGSYAFYEPDMQERASERLTLETRLRRAVQAEEFEVHYQPKVDLKTGLVVGLEALLRWPSPDLGPVSPLTFIPLLEETGLIHEVGGWVLDRAAKQHRQWHLAGLRPPRIAVNVSAIQLAAPELEQLLRNCAAVSDGIDIEITESVFVKDLAGSVARLNAARKLGLAVAIDDFGTGYSSLSYLSRLPIDSLKIDRSFVIGMTRSPQETSIVMAIISLAHAMDLKVIAEGVETHEQAHLLRLLKCDQIQGYLISKPCSALDVERLLGKRYSFAETSAANGSKPD
jgi:diguanylate cyclase (GGDEF)-like protein/PAS domain S-box-containing protein